MIGDTGPAPNWATQRLSRLTSGLLVSKRVHFKRLLRLAAMWSDATVVRFPIWSF